MYLRHLFSIIFLLIIQFAQSQSLPHYMTAREKSLMMQEALLPVAPAASDVFLLPPQKRVRTIAEWEALQALQITWTSYPSILTEIIRAAKQECRVYIVCNNTQSVIDYLSARGIDTVNVSFVNTRFNSVWSRDYGPWTAYSNDVDSLYTIDWKYNRPRPQDDTIPYTLGRLLQTPTFTTTTAPWKLVNTGGNFMTDGFGTGFASKLILDENKTLSEAGVDSIMQNFMGINRYIKMTTLPYDDIHHIDMHMKLLDEETLLVGQYPDGVADGPQIEANLQYILTNFKSVFGTPFKVIRIPMPDDKGKFTDVTQQVAPAFAYCGMVRGIVFSDVNGDKQADMIVSGEWMPITVFRSGMILTDTSYRGQLNLTDTITVRASATLADGTGPMMTLRVNGVVAATTGQRVGALEAGQHVVGQRVGRRDHQRRHREQHQRHPQPDGQPPDDQQLQQQRQDVDRGVQRRQKARPVRRVGDLLGQVRRLLQVQQRRRRRPVADRDRPLQHLRRRPGPPITTAALREVRRLLSPLLLSTHPLRELALGAAMGFLPCMIPAWALGQAATTGSPVHGAAVMLLLVLLTTPVLLLTTQLPRLGWALPQGLRSRLARWLPAVSGVWLLLVGGAGLGLWRHAHLGITLIGHPFMMMLF